MQKVLQLHKFYQFGVENNLTQKTEFPPRAHIDAIYKVAINAIAENIKRGGQMSPLAQSFILYQLLQNLNIKASLVATKRISIGGPKDYHYVEVDNIPYDIASDVAKKLGKVQIGYVRNIKLRSKW